MSRFIPDEAMTFQPTGAGGSADGRSPGGIQVRGLTRTFGGRLVVDDLDLHVDPGEIYAFLGPNGAGKSTTVLMLTTLLEPSSGTAVVAGHDVRRDAKGVRAAIGAALQATAIDPTLTGAEQLRLHAALHGVPRRERRARVAELLDRVGLTDAAGRRAATYSGGMRRRLDLAIALVHHPRVLFLDEPTTGLDPQSRVAMWEEVRRLAVDEGVTVFLTTQYLEEADALADRVGIISGGRLVREGTPRALKATVGPPTLVVQPRSPGRVERLASVLTGFGTLAPAEAGSVAVRLAGGARALPAVVRALDAARIVVEHLELSEPSLDEVFLDVTGRLPEGA